MSREAFGSPGLAPTWCSSDKDFVTTGLGASRLWATIGHGILNEVYWPSTGEPQIRDVGFYLLSPGRWIDLKRVRRYRVSTPAPAVPLPTITHYGEDYELRLEFLTDPNRDALLMNYRLDGPYSLVLILAPHLAGSGRDNDAWIEAGRGFAQHGDCALCLTADGPLQQLSCGFVGTSDGWQDLARHGTLTYQFDTALAGTVALSARLAHAHGVLALGFAEHPRGAETLARTALAQGYEPIREAFLDGWNEWSSRLRLPQPDSRLGDEALLSAAVLKIHEDRAFPGAVVASLSIPWGNSAESLGGYHLVWPRDATLTAFAFLAASQLEDARRMLAHLISAQCTDGHWPQNYFPSGDPYWNGEQLDETAFPVLLAAKLRELGSAELPETARMVRAACAFVARTGPYSEQDRWEENPGVSAFTVAIAIAALVAGAQWLEGDERSYALDLADDWNERLEGWCYVQDTPLAHQIGVSGYYVRIARPDKGGDQVTRIRLRNRLGEQILAAALVSLDFSYLVRLGLRDAHDPRVQDTIKVVDQVLRVPTPSGALYHRYNEDGYGERPDGRAFDGTGVGRAWPLLAGERGHLALQSGEDPLEYLETMARCASPGGLLPEQVWDAAAIPALELAPGRPSGSAMPLLWSHAEFLKLLVAREQRRPIEQLQSVRQRYQQGAERAPQAWHWRAEVPIARLHDGRALVIEDHRPFALHLGWDGWQRIEEREAVPQPFGLWGVHFSALELARAAELNFTRRYREGWEGQNQRIELGHAVLGHALEHVGS